MRSSRAAQADAATEINEPGGLRELDSGQARPCTLESEQRDQMNAAAPTSVCVSYNLRKASRIVSKVYAGEMRSAPVRGPQFSLMMMIARRQSPTISELARDTGADRTTMTRNLDQLEKKGLIRVTQGKNMRTKAVELAPKGKVALERSLSYWQKAQAKVLKTLGEERWNRMLNDLAVLSTLAMQSNNAIKA